MRIFFVFIAMKVFQLDMLKLMILQIKKRGEKDGFKVERGNDLNSTDIARFVGESEAEGYQFLTRVVSDYNDGSNTFSKPGEAFFKIRYEKQGAFAIGGVNQSPFSEDKQTARLKRFYVLEDARRQRIDFLLLKEIIDHSRGQFNKLTVCIESSKADIFYRENGFEWDDSASETTHVMVLNEG